MILLITTLWILMGGITSYMAKKRGRDPYIWFAIGVLFGLIGLLILLLLPIIVDEEKKKTDTYTSEISSKNSLDPWKEWYYADNKGQQMGPLSLELLKDQWKAQSINAHSFVWSEGMASWKRIEEEPLLFQFLNGGS